MANPRQLRNLIFNLSFSAAAAALAIAFLLIVVATPAQAQTFTVLHTFTGGQDGTYLTAGVTLDQAGNLYGTADEGGGAGYGTVYKLRHNGSGWIFNLLYSFNGGDDGAYPGARVVFGPNGTLYGTTSGGGASSQGTVFNLRPSPTVCLSALCAWTETVVYPFAVNPDGANPAYGDLIFDQAGNIFGTTGTGGNNDGNGTVYELTPSGSGWTESVLYRFSGNDGSNPQGGLILDNAGSLYGTTYRGGGFGGGTIFELTPSGSGWTEKVLYNFRTGTDGGAPIAGLIFDPSGNLYGATTDGGPGGAGTVFKLTPSGGSWTYSLLYSLAALSQCGPWGTLVMDGAGNLYGTTLCTGTHGFGSVFELTPSGPPWTYTSLHDFTDGSDGGRPISNVVIDPVSGNLYGTAGSVVWEITFP